MSIKLDNKRIAWECKIGIPDGVEVPRGGDAPMRRAVEKAFKELTGVEAEACFSGWGAKFTPGEMAVIGMPVHKPTGPASQGQEGAP